MADLHNVMTCCNVVNAAICFVFVFVAAVLAISNFLFVQRVNFDDYQKMKQYVKYVKVELVVQIFRCHN